MPNWSGKAYYLDSKDVDNAFLTICTSGFVSGRPEYAGRLMLETELSMSDSTEINAYASRFSDDEIKAQIPENQEAAKNFIPKRFEITVTEGILQWMSAMAVVAATLDRTKSSRKARNMLKWMYKASTYGHVGSDFMLRLWDKFNLATDSVMVEICGMYAKTMLTAIIAHECGHICLGHCPYAGQDVNYSLDRNDERQADTFMSSVMQSTCAGAQGAIGAIMAFIGLRWASNDRKDKESYYTHPASHERLNMLFNDFAAPLTVSHITRNQLRDLL